MKAIVTFCLAISMPSLVAAQDPSIEQAVDDLTQKWTDAYNAGNAGAATSFYTEDADAVGFRGSYTKGHAQIAELLSDTMDTYKGSKVRVVCTGLHVISPDVVVTDGSWEFSGGTIPEGSPTKGFYTFILAKEGDAWKIAAHRVKVPPAS